MAGITDGAELCLPCHADGPDDRAVAIVQVAGEELLVQLIQPPVGQCIPLSSAGSTLRMVPRNAPNLAQVRRRLYTSTCCLMLSPYLSPCPALLGPLSRCHKSPRTAVGCAHSQLIGQANCAKAASRHACGISLQVSMASGLDWNSEEEGTTGAHALKVEDLIELSEGNSGQSTQASHVAELRGLACADLPID